MFSFSGVATVASEFIGAVEPAVEQVEQLAGVDPATAASIKLAMDEVKGAAAALATADSAAEAAPLAQRLVTDGKALVDLLNTTPNLPTEVRRSVQIADVVFGVLPGILAMLEPPPPPAAA